MPLPEPAETFLGFTSTAWTAWGAVGSILAAGGALGGVLLTRHQIFAAKMPYLTAGSSVVSVSVEIDKLTVYGKSHDEQDVPDNHYPRVPVILTNLGLGVAKRVSYSWDFNAKEIVHLLNEGYFKGSAEVVENGVSFKSKGGNVIYECEDRLLEVPFIAPGKQFKLNLPYYYLHLYSLALAAKDLSECIFPADEIEFPSIGLTLTYQDVYGRELTSCFKIKVSAHKPTFAGLLCYEVAFTAYHDDMKASRFDKFWRFLKENNFSFNQWPLTSDESPRL